MKTYLLISLLLSCLAYGTEANIRFRQVSPSDGSTVVADKGLVQFSSRVFDSNTDVSMTWVKLYLAKDGVNLHSKNPDFVPTGTKNEYVYNATDLEDNTEYCYRIKTKNSIGERRRTPLRCFKTLSYGLQPDCFEADDTKFRICLDLASDSGRVESFMSQVIEAKDAWENTIISNGLYYPDTSDLDANDTATGSYPPAIGGMYMAFRSSFVDGAGGVLGSSEVIYVASFTDGTHRPLTGKMTWDLADIKHFDDLGFLKELTEHEMGHVLGIGTLWERNGLIDYPNSNLYYGENVIRQWESQGCDLIDSGAPIIEMDGSAGTPGRHFDEQCLDKDVMTIALENGMFVSNFTLGTLADMGYTVDYSVAKELSLASPCCTQTRRLGSPIRKAFSKRRLSPEMQEIAVAYGTAELKKSQEIHQSDVGLQVNSSNASYLFVDNSITVYVLENGHIVDVVVTLDD